MGKKLYKSNRNKVLFGVCGGLAEYFNIDVTLVRLVFIVLALSGAGVLAYIIAAIVIPEESYDSWQSSGDSGDYRTAYSSAYDEDTEWKQSAIKS
jgi:phage shock protein C